MHSNSHPFRVLFLCTANSARSQIAEALLTAKAQGRFVVASAGSYPAELVNPLALRALREINVDWVGKHPKGIEAVVKEQWDIVITVCDRARESCPTFPGQPVFAHWSTPDPAEAVGSEEEWLRAFRDALHFLNRRIDLMLALPIEQLAQRVLEQHMESTENQETTAETA